MGTHIGVMFPPSPSGSGCWEPAGSWGAQHGFWWAWHILVMLGGLGSRSFKGGIQDVTGWVLRGMFGLL